MSTLVITSPTPSPAPPVLPAPRDELVAALLADVPSRAVHGKHCGCCAPWSVALESLATLDRHAERILRLAAMTRRDAHRAAQSTARSAAQSALAGTVTP